MIKSMKMIILILIFLSSYSGCLSYVASQDYDSEPDKNKAYIYGSFVMDNYYELAIVLVLKNKKTGNKHNIKFESYTHSRPKKVSIIPINPGEYQIQEIIACPARRAVFTFESTDCSERKNFDCKQCEKFSKSFNIKKGTAYYIGDYLGLSYGTNGGSSIKWEIIETDDNFKKTTEELKSLYKKFSSVPVYNAFETD